MTLTAPAVRLRPFYCPVAPAKHPESELLNRRTVQWVRDHGLYADDTQRRRLEHVNAGLLAGLTSPGGLLEPTQVSADSLMWLFAFDDAHCDEGSLGRDPLELSRVLIRLLRILEAPEAPIPPSGPYRNFELALRDLHGRLTSCATPVQVGRWIDAMRMYFLCQVREAADRTEKAVPDLADYALLRIHNGAMRVSVMLLDIADGYELPAADMDRADVRALTEVTCLLVGWDNDILSFRKEHTRTEDAVGLLDVLAHARDEDVSVVMDEAMLLRDQLMVLFERLGQQVIADASTDLRRYVASLGHWIRANLEWGMTCERYREPGGTSPLDLQWADTPTPLSEAPVPVPTIAWWWRQLGT
ncbi:hypothetical protein ABZ719_16635 [Streptomyces sp. NPDC006743]|uniref:terpene synthase family protein n=1 Tax=Streptomyces sp. NPDC006743 TaxID=3154480 RepID=UPI0034558E0C